MAVLRLPKGSCDHLKLIKAIADAGLAPLPTGELTLVIDSRHLSCGALAMLAAWGLRCRAQGARFALSPSARVGDLSYPARMDLFRLLEIPFQEPFERHEPGARFLPLLAVGAGAAPIGTAVAQILALIEGHFRGATAFMPALSWIVQELVDNIANHANSPTPGIVCAQFYPSRQQLELAIWDAGIGLFQSLSPAFPKLFSDGDAISKALEAGVTRDPNIGQGNGLAGSCQLVAANGGSFQLWSGNATYTQADGKAAFKLSAGPQRLPGTGLLLALRTDRPLELARLTLTSPARFLRSGAAPSARVLRLADEDCRGGRAAARALRQRLLALLAAADAPLTVDFQDVPPLAHSFLDELFGRAVTELGGYQPFLERVQLRHADDWTQDVLHYVLIQRHGLPEAAPAPTGPSDPLRANLALLGAPKTLALWGPAAELPLEPPWLRELWPQAQLPAQPELAAPTAAWLEQLALAPRPLLLVASTKAEHLLERAIADLDRHDQLFLLVPPVRFNQRGSQLRQLLYARDLLRCLVLLPLAPSQRSAYPQLALVGLGPLRPRELPHSFAFLDGQALARQTVQKPRELTILLEGHPCHNAWGYRFTLPHPDHQLDYHQDHPDQRQKDRDIQTHLGLIPLAELLDFCHDGLAAQSLAPCEGQLQAIGARELAALPDLARADCPRVAAELGRDQLPIAAGDILFRALKGEGLARVATPDLAGLLPAYGILHLRPRRPDLADTLAAFLQSAWFSHKLFAHRATASAADLCAQLVPDPDSAPIQKLIKLGDLSRQLHRLADDFENTRRELLVDDLKTQLRRLGEVELLADVLAESSAAYHDFGRQVELFYPQPLAEAWRKIQLQTSIEGRWEAVFLALETAVQFTACAVLAGYRQRGDRLPVLTQLFAKLTDKGVTLGEWSELLGQVRRDGSLDAFPELERLLVENRERSPWWLAQKQMRALRNEKSHHRGPRTGLDYQSACREAETHLEAIYRGLSCLSRYRLIEVVTCALDPLTERRTAQVRELVGDHPDVKIKQRELAREHGPGLYLEDGQGALHLISPWLLYTECPHHHKGEVFNPESMEGEELHYKGVYCGKLLPRPKDHLQRLKTFVGL